MTGAKLDITLKQCIRHGRITKCTIIQTFPAFFKGETVAYKKI